MLVIDKIDVENAVLFNFSCAPTHTLYPDEDQKNVAKLIQIYRYSQWRGRDSTRVF